jgi:hypothetical protein
VLFLGVLATEEFAGIVYTSGNKALRLISCGVNAFDYRELAK